MPKETFFNLSDDKRNKIIEAAKEEFTEYTLHKARVSNIINKAGIPRGSFYQYFIDLEDLYFHVIDLYISSIYDSGATFAKQTNDLFEFSMLSFDYDYEAFTNDKRHKFMGNIIKSISDNPEYISGFNDKRLDYVKSILKEMDLSLFRHKEEDELLRIYYLIQSLKHGVVQKSFFDKLSKEEAKEEFAWRLDIVRHGVEVK